jgi:DNA-binding response OmpR family regulator
MAGRILLVVESATVRSLFTNAVRAHGLQIDELSDGNEAVEAIRSGRYKVVVLDLHLPGTDGFAILRKIQEEPRQPVILALSGSSADVRRVAGDRAVRMCVDKAFAVNNVDPLVAAIVAVAQMR